MSNLVVRELKQAEWDQWDEWLVLQPWGSPFSSSWWLAASCRLSGGSPLILAVLDGRKLTAGVSLRVATVGPMHVVRPSPHYNPIVLSDGSPRRQQLVLGALLDGIVRRGLIAPSLTCTPDMVDMRAAAWKGWRITPEWTVVNTLPEWSLEKSCPHSLRANVRKARDTGIMVAIERPDGAMLAEFMDTSMARHGEGNRTSVHQLNSFMEAGGGRTLFVVSREKDGTPISAACYMWNGSETAFGLWAGSSPRGLSVGACSLTYATGLSELQRRGFKRLDWCGGNLPGVSDYKLEFGGELVTRLFVSREPAWFRSAFRAYVRLAQLKGVLRRHRG